MTDVTIKLENVSALSLAQLNALLDEVASEVRPFTPERALFDRLRDALSVAEEKQWAAEKIEV
jgi:hypothetical protein